MEEYDNSEYRLRARNEAIARGDNHVDVEKLKELLGNTTQGPWHWVGHDYSMASLQGPAEEWDHVVSVGPCDACRERAKNQSPEWQWGRCTCPSESDAKLMAMAPALAETLIKKMEYPKKVADHIWQYDENTYLWEDETQNWGGVAWSIEEATRQMKEYAKTL